VSIILAVTEDRVRMITDFQLLQVYIDYKHLLWENSYEKMGKVFLRNYLRIIARSITKTLVDYDACTLLQTICFFLILTRKEQRPSFCSDAPNEMTRNSFCLWVIYIYRFNVALFLTFSHFKLDSLKLQLISVKELSVN